MARPPSWFRRTLLLAVLAAVAVGVVRRGRTGRGLLPVIGGDVWPPVPVKAGRPA